MKHCIYYLFIAGLILFAGAFHLTGQPAGSDKTFPGLRFDFGHGKLAEGYIQVTADMQYTPERGYGFISGTPLTDVNRKGRNALLGDFCTGSKPFFFAVDLLEGNYEVSLWLGDRKGASVTTVKAESRRLMLEEIRTKKGEFRRERFNVNVRTPVINGGDTIRLKARELSYLNWDNKLTLEFNNSRPCINALEIRKADTVVNVFLAGNSTVTDQEREPWASWGQMIPCFFNDHVVVSNYAESGEALKSFVAGKRLKKIMSLIRPGDYLFIEFGHNDQKPESASYVEPFTGYKEQLKLYIRQAQERGARPVLLTPVRRRKFDEQGKLINTHGDYPEAMRQVAREENVPLIDLNEMTKVFYEALGVEGSKKAFVHAPAGTYPGQATALKDDSHHNKYGAYEVARCVVEGIRMNKLELANHLVRGLPAFIPSNPDPPESFHIPDSPAITPEKPEGQ